MDRAVDDGKSNNSGQRGRRRLPVMTRETSAGRYSGKREKFLRKEVVRGKWVADSETSWGHSDADINGF